MPASDVFSGSHLRHYFMTALAMLAFASNSILCRLALGEREIDAASFTSIRLLSGAIMLLCILYCRNNGFRREKIKPVSSLMLFIYAICFSFSYMNLSAATGALILFGAVQLTMLMFGLLKGERPASVAWFGMVCAFAGLVYLLLPGVSAPPPLNALLMLAAGVAWAIYTLQGKGDSSPLTSTCWNFIGTLPLLIPTVALFYADMHMTVTGLLLAIVSGALASALGYVIWYGVLPRLGQARAGSVQLSVPVIAALGGVLVLAEPISARLLIASIVVLGGVYLAIRPVTQIHKGR